MDSCTNKLYHVHGFDSRLHLENYFSDKPEMVFAEDSLVFPVSIFEFFFSTGHINGDILIDLSPGSLIHHLYSACDFFKNIIVLKPNDRCILELKRWVDTRTGAFDWGHATKLHVNMEENSDQFQEKEEKVRSAIQRVMKCNLDEENITDPIVLPPADCIISACLLDFISRDQDDYIKYLKKVSSLLKPGGHLILIGLRDVTYYTVGKERFQAFTYDEEFVRKALAGEGFVIDDYKSKKRTAESDLVDYKEVLFIVAHKEK
ncbi:indolethylamine N-methyltransferase-like [Bufo bufo]|uniref:indolethylamine N-methyltransferase-like n=1 Tax=Bufo bufo TaxID=8384 RepID=UPI001ABEE53F|nr:indolethylamine N-methyltransferase-like [Bufo bufo]